MLDVMRSNAKSSLIALIFGAIIVTFIFSFGRGSSGFRTRTPETWAARVIEQVGNYSEMFERNLGAGSPLRLDRGVNALWTNGGLMYAPPLR